MARERAVLILEDGRRFSGVRIGSAEPAFGEVIFNTSMTGYQEIASDPSYCGQIVTLTAPQIGNYGVCELDAQAERPALGGLVVRELSPIASNRRAAGDLESWMVAHGVAGISEVDTRALTRHIRQAGEMRAGIFSGAAHEEPTEALLERVRGLPSLVGRDLASQVTTAEPYRIEAEGDVRAEVVVLDFGVKRGILRSLTRRGLAVTVMPVGSSAADVLARGPAGVVLSNGPGDPEPVKAGIEAVGGLLGRLPILGICLGHQVLSQALGARTYKMRFGHHGGNHPVADKVTGEVWITAQNHGFAVEADSLPPEAEVTHVSLYDGTLEGFCDRARRVIAVQFHPEACPGPSDAAGVFDRFVDLLEGR